MTGLCEAYVVAMEAIASRVPERPFPKSLVEVDVGDWKLAVNTTGEPVPYGGAELPPYEVVAQHKVYFVIAGFGPGGGIIGGGMPEGEFIEQMRALASVDRSGEAGETRSEAEGLDPKGESAVLSESEADAQTTSSPTEGRD